MKKLNNFSNIYPMFLILQNTQIMRNSIYLWFKKISKEKVPQLTRTTEKPEVHLLNNQEFRSV